MVTVDEHQGLRGLASLAPELVLRTAYAQFGITAVPKLVRLVVTDPANDHARGYGTSTPRINSKNQFVGHMGLWLPRSCQFIDHTVGQFPEIRAMNPWPVVLLLGTGDITDWHQAQGGFVTERGRLELTYTPWPEADNARILAHPHLAQHAELYHRVGVNIASELLGLLRQAEFRERALATPHTRLHTLLGIIGDAAMRTSADDYVRFVLPGTEQASGVYLDQIPVPDDQTDA